MPVPTNNNMTTTNPVDAMPQRSCPVAHDPAQPLPPGHPPVADTEPSSLQPPTDARCIFFRTAEDTESAPSSPAPAESSTSAAFPVESASARKAHNEHLKQLANASPLPAGAGATLDPERAVVLASRDSQLALVQTSHVHSMLEARYGSPSPAFAASGEPRANCGDSDLVTLQARLTEMGLHEACHFPITGMSTVGDINQRSPLYVIGGEGRAIWTKELQTALHEGAVDAIVHSLKDIPTTQAPGSHIAAILEREDPRDALVVKHGVNYQTLDDLPPGSVIGTSSVRRVAQLRARYPKLVFSDVRGNINTRLAKLDATKGPYTALVLAAAGLHRLGMHDRITAYLQAPVLYYSVGQGSLGVEIRTPPAGASAATNRDARIAAMVQSIGCWKSTFMCEAERALLRKLEGGCSVPVGVDTWFGTDDEAARRAACAARIPRTRSATPQSDPSTPQPVEEVVIEGHEISSTRPSTPRLEQLARGASAARGDAQQHSETQQQPAIPKLPSPHEMNVEDRATPPKEGARLNMVAHVVSLDGSRRANAYAAAQCTSLAEARALGDHLADVLVTAKGAKEILAEVERHRALAEQADVAARRRPSTTTTSGTNGTNSTNGKRANEDDQQHSEVIGLKRLRPDDASSATSSSTLADNAGMGFGEKLAGVQAEVDRRFLPRADGQLKAWEV